MRFGLCLHAGAVTQGSLGLHPTDRQALSLAISTGAELVALEAVGDRGTSPRAAAEALAMGAARAVRIVDPALVTADAQATAFVLAMAFEALGVDLVLFGTEADPEGAQDVPACIAQHMGAVYLDGVFELMLDDAANKPNEPSVLVRSRAGGLLLRDRVPLNAVLGITPDAVGPVLAGANAASASSPSAVEVLTLGDINVDATRVRSGQDRRGAIDTAPRPLVTLHAARAIATLLRR